MNLINKSIFAALLSSSMLFNLGCGGEEPVKEPIVVVKTIVKKPKKKAKTIDVLKEELSIDNRIFVNEMEAPQDEKSRIALLIFFDSLLKCDETTLNQSISMDDQLELSAMIASGLHEYMNTVSRLDLKIGLDSSGEDCAMGVFEVGMDYQVQLWYFKNDGQKIAFSSISTPPNLVNILSGNWIESYFAFVAKQKEIALQPDAGSSYVLAGEMDKKTTPDSEGDTPRGPPSRPGGPKAPGR